MGDGGAASGQAALAQPLPDRGDEAPEAALRQERADGGGGQQQRQCWGQDSEERGLHRHRRSSAGGDQHQHSSRAPMLAGARAKRVPVPGPIQPRDQRPHPYHGMPDGADAGFGVSRHRLQHQGAGDQAEVGHGVHRAGATMTGRQLTIAHGGGLIAARAQFPEAPEPWIDLSTGINAVPYPVPPVSPAAFHRLPETEDVRRLEAAAARAYGVADPAMVVAAPGTQILISLLPRLLPMDSVAVVGPTYAEHAASWAAAGSVIRIVDSIGTIGTERAAVLCNPNNPDGRRTRKLDLMQLATRLDLLVVDEAFADLEEPGLSLAPTLPANAVVLRSFGKTYGLAGIRLGFAIAAPILAQIIRVALGPWAVSGAAIEIGIAALADTNWLTAARERLAHEVTRLDPVLTNAGMQVVGGTRLYRLAQTSKAMAIFERLGRAGILVRRFETQPTWLRFGIPGGGWDRIEAALIWPAP